MSETPLNQDQSSGEIDLRDLFITLWVARKQILIIAFIFAFIGGLEGFLIQPTYTASSTFLPQTTQAGGAASSLGGLAALAGINLNETMSGGDIPPSMYATVLASEPFRKSILDGKILINGDSLTYRNFLEGQSKNSNRTILSSLKEYTIGLPVKITSLFSSNEGKNVNITDIKGIQTLSDKEYGLLNTVLAKVKIENNNSNHTQGSSNTGALNPRNVVVFKDDSFTKENTKEEDINTEIDKLLNYYMSQLNESK
jgi:hypothetical protein